MRSTRGEQRSGITETLMETKVSMLGGWVSTGERVLHASGVMMKCTVWSSATALRSIVRRANPGGEANEGL